MAWRIVIDQRASLGGSQRYEWTSSFDFLSSAIDESLARVGLVGITGGEYQITATPVES